MSVEFDILRKDWSDDGYDGILILPIKTDLIIK
jgi:hypothetical protein